jgi:adenylate cyclase class 2
MQEIELKILEIDGKKIKEKLDSFANKISENVLLTTITFSNPYTNALVRLRKINNETIFTIKVVIVPDKKFKIRKEYETKIDNFKIFKKQLEILGFKQTMLQEKKRTTYKYKNSEIVIDTYPKIPSYIEVEGTKEEIEEIVNKLNYKMEDTTQTNVYSLFEKYNVDARELRFKEN